MSRDPLEREIEAALSPGRFIGWRDGSAFVGGLRFLLDKIREATTTDAARAVSLLETFFACCNEKAEEVDDSDGELGQLVGDLVCEWIRTRQVAACDSTETVERLLSWIDDDPYGFCSEMDRKAVDVFDDRGLQVFEEKIRSRFEDALADDKNPPEQSYLFQSLGDVLKAICSRRDDLDGYLALCQRTGTMPADCDALAALCERRDDLPKALAWIEQGIDLEESRHWNHGITRDLAKRRRDLLLRLGRGAEALEDAWSGFQRNPSPYTYEELMRFVSKPDRAEWHARAMDTAAEGEPGGFIALCVETDEIERLAERIRTMSDGELQSLSHFTTEPAAARVEPGYPDLAARIHRALGMRIVDAGKSRYYDAALSHFDAAKRCYERAGRGSDWEGLVRTVREKHRRKTGFMPAFERVVSGKRVPSFVDSARARWLRQR
jgi:tetratricopeptide (TPR) repeat protein